MTAPTTCAEACADLYACSVLTCNGQQNCGALTGDPTEETNFLSFCGQACASQMALISLVDPASCDTTVQTFQTLSVEYEAICTTGSSSSSSSSSSASSSTGGGMVCALPDTTAPSDCTEACSDLYDCGALTCNGQQNCPGFDGTPMNRSAFLAMCGPQCQSQPTLVSLVDPSSCDTLVQTLSGLSAMFDTVCQNGP
jgi:hypothetical protein